MSQIQRYRWTMSGGSVGTGYVTFYSGGTASSSFAAATGTLMNALFSTTASGATPQGISLVPDSFVDLLDPVSGELQDSQGITPPATIVGANTGTYAAPSGACVTWITAGVVNGHRVRGRTFIVPISSTKFQNDGTLDPTYQNAIKTAAGSYISGGTQPVVWHRPTRGAGGAAYTMTGASVRDRVAELTSRR